MSERRVLVCGGRNPAAAGYTEADVWRALDAVHAGWRDDSGDGSPRAARRGRPWMAFDGRTAMTLRLCKECGGVDYTAAVIYGISAMIACNCVEQAHVKQAAILAAEQEERRTYQPCPRCGFFTSTDDPQHHPYCHNRTR